MNFRCLLGHKYKPLRVHHYWDTSYGQRFASTDAVFKCAHCGKLKQKLFYKYGWLTLKELE